MENTFTHKCHSCGGPLLFDPKEQKFHCNYCLNFYAEEEVSEYEQQEVTGTENAPIDSLSEAMELFNCPNCGAQIVTNATTAATYCYYCHNPVVLSGRLSGEFLPDKILPFAIEKEEAVEIFLDWTKKKRFIPKAFFNKKQIDKLTGVYFPYWVVDTELEGHLNAVGTTVRIWRIGDIEYTETKKYGVQRQGKLNFKEFLKNALSTNAQKKMITAVQPFHLENAVHFKSHYLAGFQAEKRDLEYKKVKKALHREIKDYSEILLKDSASQYTTLAKVHTSITPTLEQRQYMLLPIWLVTYRKNDQSDKVYYYAMNGQTAKVSGVLPISYPRLVLSTFGIFTFTLLLFLIGGYLI